MEFGKKKGFFGRLSERIGDVILARPTIDEDLLDDLEEGRGELRVAGEMEEEGVHGRRAMAGVRWPGWLAGACKWCRGRCVCVWW